jgi:hypothetical protein
MGRRTQGRLRQLLLKDAGCSTSACRARPQSTRSVARISVGETHSNAAPTRSLPRLARGGPQGGVDRPSRSLYETSMSRGRLTIQQAGASRDLARLSEESAGSNDLRQGTSAQRARHDRLQDTVLQPRESDTTASGTSLATTTGDGTSNDEDRSRLTAVLGLTTRVGFHSRPRPPNQGHDKESLGSEDNLDMGQQHTHAHAYASKTSSIRHMEWAQDPPKTKPSGVTGPAYPHHGEAPSRLTPVPLSLLLS